MDGYIAQAPDWAWTEEWCNDGGRSGNEGDVITLANLLKRYYSSKVRQYFPDICFFIQLYKEIISEGMGDIIIVRYKGKIIGGAVCFYDEEKAYLLFSGGLNKTYYAHHRNICSPK